MFLDKIRTKFARNGIRSGIVAATMDSEPAGGGSGRISYPLQPGMLLHLPTFPRTRHTVDFTTSRLIPWGKNTCLEMRSAKVPDLRRALRQGIQDDLVRPARWRRRCRARIRPEEQKL